VRGQVATGSEFRERRVPSHRHQDSRYSEVRNPDEVTGTWTGQTHERIGVSCIGDRGLVKRVVLDITSAEIPIGGTPIEK
jgi:hypothetical protein